MEGQRLGGYQILRKLGEGGMGAVYEARALTPGAADGGERVAVKVLRPEYARNQAMVDRFFNEARALHRVDHEGTVAMIDCGLLDEETVYLVMEYLEGQTLKDRLRDGGALERQAALNVIWQLAGTLAAAHEKGIIHRDLKPDNVMLVADPQHPGHERAKLLDFGIAKLLTGPEMTAENTGSGAMIGTPAYMSPEQCRGDGVINEKSDVYALGVLSYELLAGVKPYRGEGAGELIGQHLYATPRPLAELAPEVSPEIIDLVRRMMAKQPDARPRMREVAEMLRYYGAALRLRTRATLASSSGIRLPRPPGPTGGTKASGSAAASAVKASGAQPARPPGSVGIKPPGRSRSVRRRLLDLLGVVVAVVLICAVLLALAWLFMAYHR